jgi:hypothetical protein
MVDALVADARDCKAAWKDAAGLAGYKAVPKWDSHTGRTIRESYKLAMQEKVDLEFVQAAQRVRDMDPFDYEEQWKVYKPVADLIARGEEKPTTGQVQLLKDLEKRAYEQHQKKQDKTQERPVVVLPSIGERENQFICPNCLTQYDEDHWGRFIEWYRHKLEEEKKSDA